MKEFLIKRKRVFLILTPAFLGVLYMALCIFNLRQSIWFDESFSSYLTRFDFGKIWSLTAADVHPPLYYFLLKIWAHAFGHVDFAMRMMSTVFGAVAILFAFLWLKYKYGLKAAMVASFLLSISPVFVRYGQEMRMYTMVLAIVFAATYFLQLAIDNGKKIWWIIYAVLVAAGMWTHYFAAFAWCAHLVYLLITYGVKGFLGLGGSGKSSFGSSSGNFSASALFRISRNSSLLPLSSRDFLRSRSIKRVISLASTSR